MSESAFLLRFSSVKKLVGDSKVVALTLHDCHII